MLKYIDESDYQNLMDAPSIPEDFNKKNIEASNYIRNNTFDRVNINNIPESVKYVTCLIIDKLVEKEEKLKEIGCLKSEDVEGWKTTYATPDEVKIEYDKKLSNILNEYLFDEIGVDGLPLLYRGLR